MSRTRVGILISGRGSNMTALIEAARSADFPAEIALVLASDPAAAGLARASEAGLATACVDHRPFGRDREAFERTMQAVLEAHGVHLVCLAGFMRLLTPWFISRWEQRILNIHPALLPSFKGLHTHERALEAGVRIHGATVHFVVPDMDAGPIIAQGAVAVREDDTPETLGARVLAVEHRIYPNALRLVGEGRVRLVGGRCFVAGTRAPDTTLLAP